MKLMLCLALSAIAAIGVNATRQETEGSRKNRLIISGELVEIGPPTPVEGEVPLQLVKYRVANVCEGTYDDKVVLVYHMPDSGDLEDAKVGERQCIRITESIKADGRDKQNQSPPVEIRTKYFALDVIRNCQCSAK